MVPETTRRSSDAASHPPEGRPPDGGMSRWQRKRHANYSPPATPCTKEIGSGHRSTEMEACAPQPDALSARHGRRHYRSGSVDSGGDGKPTAAVERQRFHPDSMSGLDTSSRGISKPGGLQTQRRRRSVDSTPDDRVDFWQELGHEPTNATGAVGSLVKSTPRQAHARRMVLEERGRKLARGASPLFLQIRFAETIQLGEESAAMVAEGQHPHRILNVNQRWLHECGFRRNEVVGSSFGILQGKQSDLQQLDKVMGALAHKRAGEAKLVNYRSDGTPFLCTTEVAPRDIDCVHDCTFMFVITMEDIQDLVGTPTWQPEVFGRHFEVDRSPPRILGS